MSINTIYDDDENVYQYVALFSDITEKKKNEQLIWTQANYDSLTQLPNRRMFRDRLQQEVKKCHRSDSLLALFFIDLDHFKEVNDTLGHDLGDKLLIEAARRIESCVRTTDTVARLGGDEFTVILSELDDLANIERVASAITEVLRLPFNLANELAYVSASIGITIYPDDTIDTDDLVRNADQAMYLAKDSGRNRFSYFTKSMQEKALYRQHLLNDLHFALEEQQFELYYQPIIDLTTGEIIKAEALLRWHHPVRGLVSPVEFIPLAEESGMIVEIGNWVFKEAARQASLYQKKIARPLQISINKSPVQFHMASDHSNWSEYLKEINLPGESIVIEITEGLLMNKDSHIDQQLVAFHKLGMQIAVDDFGTGYSSLSYLSKFDIDYLKIDQSFVQNLTASSDELSLCEAIIVMAHKLGLKVIAEGIETEQQKQLLSNAGCDFGQGYLFAKPLPAKEFEKLLI
ncbi:MAG: EAL domain-containing protein [Methylophaga sp.]|nr:EAL domain-containing protein [Methylophaga sp.]